MLEMVRVPAWLFRTVTEEAALVELMPWLGNAISLGLTEMFCAWTMLQLETKSKTKRPKRQRSLYFTDPPG